MSAKWEGHVSVRSSECFIFETAEVLYWGLE